MASFIKLAAVQSLASFRTAHILAKKYQTATGKATSFRHFLPPKPKGVTKIYTENIPYSGGLQAGLGNPHTPPTQMSV